MPSSYLVKIREAGGSSCTPEPQEVVNDTGSGTQYRDTAGSGDLTLAILNANLDANDDPESWDLTVGRTGTSCVVWPPKTASLDSADPRGSYVTSDGQYTFDVVDV